MTMDDMKQDIAEKLTCVKEKLTIGYTAMIEVMCFKRDKITTIGEAPIGISQYVTKYCRYI